MLVQTGHGMGEMYDTTTLQSTASYSFPSRISDADFTADGKTLMVLTSDQNVYQFKADNLPQANARVDQTAK